MSNLRGVQLYVVMSSRYVFPLQKDKKLKGTVYRWHGGTTLRALGVVIVKQHMPWDGLSWVQTKC
jgi:hypothetical protein